MKIETDNETYKKLKERIAEIMPEINVNLITEDNMLRKLGFVDFVPCTIELQATEEQLEELYDMCIQFEIDVFNTPDGKYPSKNDPYYLKYLRYTWIADWLRENKL